MEEQLVLAVLRPSDELERILQVAEAISEVLQASAKVSLREILPGVTKVLLRVLELVLEVVLTALIVVVVVVVAAIDAIVVMVMVVVVTNCVAHRSFSSSLRGARACCMPTPGPSVVLCRRGAGRVQTSHSCVI